MNLTCKRIVMNMMIALGLCACSAFAQEALPNLFQDTFEESETWENSLPGEPTAATAGILLKKYKATIPADGEGADAANPWTVDGEDQSTIVKESYSYSGAAGYPAGISVHQQFLNLNTEGATAKRKIGSSGYALATTPIFTDLMVKFVMSEEEPNFDGETFKIALWANTNGFLCVRANDVAGEAGVHNITTSSKVDDAWHRLTIQTVGISSENGNLAVSRIWVDGVAVQEGLSGEAFDLADGTYWFPAADFGATSVSTLNSISFSGTGAIDDLVSTTNAPAFALPQAAGFTLTIAYDDAILDVYDGETLLTPNKTYESAGASPINVTLTAKAADWYENPTADFGAVTANGNKESSIAITATEAKTVNITASAYTANTQIQTYPGDKVARWAGAHTGVTEANFGDYVNQYLMNIAPDATADLKASIGYENGENGQQLKVTFTSTSGADLTQVNGTLTIYGKAALTDAEWTAIATENITGTTTLTIGELGLGDYKFFKAEIR